MNTHSFKACAGRCHASRPGCLSVALDTTEALHILNQNSSGIFMAKSCGLSLLSGIHEQTFSPTELAHTELVLFSCPKSSCLRAAMLNHDRQVLAYLNYESLAWNSLEADTLKSQLQTRSLRSPGCLQQCSLWLDDWSQEPPKARRPYDPLNLMSFITDCDWVKVNLSKKDFTASRSLRPSYVDFDQEIIRISDRQRRHIVYADMTRVDIIFQRSSLIISS